MDERSKRIGTRIRDIRKAKGVTLAELGDAIGVTRQQVGRLESGHRTLKPDLLEQLAEALGVPLSRLEGEDDMTSWVAELLELLGWQVLVGEAVRDEYRISFHTDVAARLTMGPLELHMAVICRQLATVEDVQGVQGFIDRSSYHVGLVVTELAPSSSTLDYASRRGTLVVPRRDLLARLMDLEDYTRRLEDQWHDQQVRFVEPSVLRTDTGDVLGLQACIDGWLSNERMSHMVLLGEPGAGKSTACQFLAAWLAKRHREDPISNPVPLLVPLWEFSYVNDMKQLIFKELLFRHGVNVASTPALERMLSEGRFVILLDGLDEMTVRLDPYVLRCNLRAIASLLGCGSRILLTARTRTFRDLQEVKEVFVRPGRWTSSSRDPEALEIQVVRLKLFDQQQVEAYLRAHSRRGWKGTMARIDHDGLGELARLPLALHMLAQTLPGLTARHGGLDSLAAVFEHAVVLWAQQEAVRMCIPKDDLLHLLEELAYQLWLHNQPQINYRQMEPGLAPLLENGDSGRACQVELNPHGIGNSLFLIRDAQGNYRFTHRTIQEYLLVRRIFATVRQGHHDQVEQFWFNESSSCLAAGMVDAEPVREQLVAWLATHPNVALRANAAFLLGLGGHPSTLQALTDAFESDPDLEVRHAAAFSLARRGQLAVVDALGEQAHATEPSLERSWARITLVLLANGHWNARDEPLIQAVKAQVPPELERDLCTELHGKLVQPVEGEAYHCAAVRAAGFVGDAITQAQLEDLLSQPSRRLRAAVQEALSVLEGRL